MSIYLNKQRKKWCYAFTINGQRFTGYCENPKTGEIATTKRDAQKIEKLVRDEIEKNLDSAAEQKEEISTPLPKYGFTLVEAIDYRLEQMKDMASLPSARTYAKELLEFFGYATPMEEVEDRIHLYIAFSKKQNVRIYKGKDEKGKNLYEVKPELRGEKSINEYLKFLTKAYR